ncbi:tRNA (guanine-N7-)-methyltransferase [Motilibacter peucedani]|uniref:tRNA (guanine-N(7)-)-methyltransferase n=1 Tax=Motilibacter peucedani TaxID=598650 RepID=A0A420XR98_9ACTN|nr:tRNA (guanosine(46)-N7)-methyltransferase TrmB [Motilibacter peucedani]RKS77331.1 tRNA (guanine-N7-)-methyltransferase [Motilibacter peucedani]
MQTEADARIRSFKLRRGRVTPGQQRALDTLWHRYGVEWAPGALPEPAELFGRTAPLVLEVGFGMGETTAAMAAADPGRDVLAVDVHTPGVGALLAEVGRRGLGNVRVATGDGVDLLRALPPASLDELRVFFPDPWPKARHHKRRLVDAGFVALAAERLAAGGRLHVATDWEPYAEQVLEVVGADERFAVEGWTPRPAHRPVTRFERQGLAKGHRVRDVVGVRR